jgi:hypothetical protein
MIAFDPRTEKGMLAGIIEFPDVRYRIEEIDPIYLSEDGKKIFFCIRDSLAEDDVTIYRKIMNMGCCRSHGVKYLTAVNDRMLWDSFRKSRNE